MSHVPFAACSVSQHSFIKSFKNNQYICFYSVLKKIAIVNITLFDYKLEGGEKRLVGIGLVGLYFKRNIMSLISLIVVLVVVGVILYLVNNFIPMDGKIKNVLNIVVLIVVILWLLSVFGILGYGHDIMVPRLH